MRWAALDRGAGIGLRRAAAVGGLAAALALVGCGGGGHGSRAASDRAPSGSRRDAAAHAHRRPPVPVALLQLHAALHGALKHAGRQIGVYVYDLDSGKALYAVKDAVMRPPASIEKLYTTIAVLSRMSPEDRLKTTVLGDGHLEPSGNWVGNLYLKGGGDPTLGDGTFNRNWEQGYGPTAAQIAQQLRRAGIRRVTGRLIGDGTLFDSLRGGLSTNFGPDIPDFGGQLSALTFDHGGTQGNLTPEAFAARQLARTLRSQHVKVKASTVPGAAREDARELVSVSSPPLSTLVRLMDVPSDDLFAEMLTKQLGARYAHAGTTAAGARIISSVIGLYGLDPTIVDGSGLSRSNLSSPAQIVDLLRIVWRTQIGRLLSDALPTVGETGTVQRIGVGTPAQGHCIAKTGTLNYVTNLAGYCMARNRHVLAFAVFIDGPANWEALTIMNHFVAALARY